MRKLLSVTLLAALVAPATSQIERRPAGQVRFYNVADSDFDPFVKRADADVRAWMNARYERMQTYSPFFDRYLAWYPNAWAYKDSYAIKPRWPVFEEHPEWVLRDESGNLLYIPWGCKDGTCPQYAGDFGNPAFRAHWIAEAGELLEKGYRGLWIDDVNLTWRVGDGNGDHVTPVDPRTGELMRLEDWRRYFAEFMEEIRAAFPDVELAHNAIWYAAPVDDPFLRRQILAADYFNFERGASDKGLREGGGKWGFETFLAFADFVHELERSVVMMDYGREIQQRDFGLAGWFLVSEGTDLMCSNQLGWSAPGSWWPGYELDLGEARGPRREWEGLLRRDFERGVVLLNQPGSATQSVNAPAGTVTIEGEAASTITLEGGCAAILRKPAR